MTEQTRLPGDLPADSDMDFVVAIEASGGHCWLSDCQGDPGRTTVPESALRFRNINDARRSMNAAKSLYPQRTYLVDVLPRLKDIPAAK
jgi:hypothetical protein